MVIKDWQISARNNAKKFKSAIIKFAKQKNPERDLPAIHEKAFVGINCLNCANCCKTISPRFNNTDISRIAKYLNIKEGAMVTKYLLYDKDGDYIANTTPCPFLLPDNYCKIYDARPKDCKNYPYSTNEIFYKQPALTIKNSTTCPAINNALTYLSNC
jgi:Fe-S-cluster containining protein